MRGRKFGAVICSCLFAAGAFAQERETQTVVDPNGNAITFTGEHSQQTAPPSSMPAIRHRSTRSGGIVPIPPFTGDRQEGFETQCSCDPPFYPCVPNGRMFQDIADLCANSAHITGGWGFRCTIQRRSGSWLYGSTGSPSTITFDDGWEAFQFGGYFGTNAGEQPDATMDFYDVDGNLIDSLVAEVTIDCQWTWNGWQSDVPIKEIVITGNNPFGGGFIMLDDMEYSQGEPAFGACCLADGSCTDDVPQVECIRAGGRFSADTLCDDLDPPCEEQVGGCCIEGGGGGCTRDPEWQCDGDTDGDGQVNPVDSGLVQAAFGSTDEQDLCNYDLDCDGQINPVDSGIVQSLFGSCNPPRDECDGGGGGDPECAVITGTECRERGGSFLGYGTDCADDPCGFAEGACCLELECAGTTRKAACDEMAGAWYEGQTCPEFECPEVVGCAWDNNIIPDGFNGRAVSPPSFPDIRVVDDVIAEQPGCTIVSFHANAVEDAGWSDGDGSITVYVYSDTGSGPGALMDEVTTEYTRMATGDVYFSRDDYDYWVEGVLIDLPVGKSWVGFRNGAGSGSGTNYWLTSDGGFDGGGSDTGYVSTDGGNNWAPEGAGWHHAFELLP